MGTKSNLSPLPILLTHLDSLRNAQGVLGSRSIIEHYVMPACLGAAAFTLNVRISASIATALVTVTGLFAAFFFQLSINILGRAASWSESSPHPSRDTTQYALLLEGISANANYSALVAFLTSAFVLIVGILSAGWGERILVAITVTLLTHLVVTILFVSIRVFLLTRARTVRARTGRKR